MTFTRLRPRLAHLPVLVFLFCLVNAGWGLIGTWAICFGGVNYSFIDRGHRESGIFSRNGWLILAVRQSYFVGAGVWRDEYGSLQPQYVHVRPYLAVSGRLSIPPHKVRTGIFNPIVEARHRSTSGPGFVLVWEPNDIIEWHNRGLAISWWWLVLLSSPALLSPIRRQTRRVKGLCPVCGYDLRATPERCPECGTVNDVRSVQKGMSSSPADESSSG